MTLLYAAFAVVALWLLGELLLQRRAPLHWRALALVGFLTLVAGVAQGSLPLIAGGVLAFGAGQALATRAVKASGGASHWSLVAPESVPVVGRLFGGEQPPPAPKGRSRAARPQPGPEPEAVAEPRPQGEAGPAAEDEAVVATAVFQADEYAVEGDSVYYPQPEPQEQHAAYYGYAAEQQASYDPYAQPYQQPYQDPYQAPYQDQGQYQEHQQYQEYQQYPEYQQQYAAYEQQQYGQDQAQYPQYAAYGSYEQAQAGYDYEQAPYYTGDAQYHAPQG